MRKLILFCGNGYQFLDFYFPIVLKLRTVFEIHLIFSNSYIGTNLLNLIGTLKSEQTIKAFYLVNFYTEKSIYKRFSNTISFLRSFLCNKGDLVVWSEEYLAISQIILNYFKEKGLIIIILPPGLLHKPIFMEYIKKTGKKENFETKKINKVWRTIREKKVLELLVFSLSFCIKTINSYFFLIKRKIYLFLNYYFYPLYFTGKLLKYNYFSRFMLLMNQSQNVIIVDSFEFKMVELLFPNVSSLYLAKHPYYGFCKKNEYNGKNLLVIVGGPMGNNISDQKLSFWSSTIDKIFKLSSPKEIHIRFHPRETKAAIGSFLQALRQKELDILVIDSIEKSVIENFCNYHGVIGSPSGALRFARNASESIFVIGLIDAINEDFYNKPIAMGDSRGILWLRDGDSFSREELLLSKRPKNQHFSVGEIIIENFCFLDK